VSQHLYRRCGCRDENGKQLGQSCPKLKSDAKHGSWAYYLSHGSDPRTQKRRQFHKAGFATRREAASAIAELKTRLDNGTYLKPTNRTLGEYALEWLPRREHSDKGLRATTVAGYEYYIREDIARSTLGGMKLADIRRYHVSEFVTGQTKAGRGTVTVRRLVTLLGTIFASAVKDELIPANPARGIERPKLDSDGVNPWEPDQVRVFLDRCAQHRLGAVFEVAVLTGLRRGEITGLRWSDVDLAARKIVVRRNRVTVNGHVREQNAPKTKAGLRAVALSDFAVATMLAWQLRQAEEAETAAEAWQTEGHVFTMDDGRPLDPAYVTRLFQKLCKGPGEELPPLSFHGLRHCAASLMLASGADIAVVSKLLGHASISITADVYGHLVGTVASDAVNGAANLIARTVLPQAGVSAR
jgi:integrase